MSNKATRKIDETTSKKGEQGFTLVEAVVAIFILTIGLLGTAAAITYALEFGTLSRNVSNAKSVIVGAIEEVETLRNARRLDFKQIANVGNVDNTDSANVFSGFSNGFKPVSFQPGPDSVNGTNDDFKNAGADNKFGTADDFDDPGFVRSGYFRQITITNLTDSLKKVEVKVRYLGAGGKVGEITGVSYLNNEARVTR
jgi:type II secretory pathway pseudopilin PulG